MNIIALALLAQHLDTVDESRFCLHTWDCGTTACAIGHAVNVPYIRDSGFQMRPTPARADVREPWFCGEVGWPAVMQFFDLTRDQAVELFWFAGDGYSHGALAKTKAKDVAAKIRKFLQDNATT